MASDGSPVKIPAASLVHGSQAQIPVSIQPRSGKTVAATAAQEAPVARSTPSVEALVAQLNKHFNDSGRPNQFRVDPNSDNKLIQQINPATGQVIGEFPVSEFAALARSVGISGVIVDQHA